LLAEAIPSGGQMKLRELLRQLLALAGDIDEEVIVRIVTRENGSVLDHLTKVAPISRVGNGTIIVESLEVRHEN
jgi:hypothetical protein